MVSLCLGATYAIKQSWYLDHIIKKTKHLPTKFSVNKFPHLFTRSILRSNSDTNKSVAKSGKRIMSNTHASTRWEFTESLWILKRGHTPQSYWLCDDNVFFCGVKMCSSSVWTGRTMFSYRIELPCLFRSLLLPPRSRTLHTNPTLSLSCFVLWMMTAVRIKQINCK